MNNMKLNMIIVILIIHYILTFFMKTKLQNKIYVNGYIEENMTLLMILSMYMEISGGILNN